MAIKIGHAAIDERGKASGGCSSPPAPAMSC